MKQMLVGLTLLASLSSYGVEDIMRKYPTYNNHVADFDIEDLRKKLDSNTARATTVSKYLREVVKKQVKRVIRLQLLLKKVLIN